MNKPKTRYWQSTVQAVLGDMARGRTGDRALGKTGDRALGIYGDRAHGKTGDRARGRTGGERLRGQNQRSDLEDFRCKAARSSSPHFLGQRPEADGTSKFGFYDVLHQASRSAGKEEEKKKKKAAAAATQQCRRDETQDGRRDEAQHGRRVETLQPVAPKSDDKLEVCHWHETLRRRSVDEEILKQRRLNLLELSSDKDKPPIVPPLSLYDGSDSHASGIPPSSPLAPKVHHSPSHSIDSNSSQDSITKYFLEFQASARKAKAKSPPQSPLGMIISSRVSRDSTDSTDSKSKDSGTYGSAGFSPGSSPILHGALYPEMRKSGTATSTPRHSSRGPHRKRRLPKTAVHASGSSSSPPAGKSEGSGESGHRDRRETSGQRRESYSKALENQKVKVILPQGNAGGRSSSGVGHGPDGNSPDVTASLHDISESGDEWDRDSLSSSTCSFSSSHPPSRNNSAYSSRSSRNSTSCMHNSVTPERRGDGDGNGDWKRGESGSRGRKLPMHEKPLAAADGGSKAKLGDNKEGASSSSSPSHKRRNDDRPGGERGGNQDGDGGGMTRQDSFEKMYDSNVNRLVEMMTGSAVPEAAQDSPQCSKQPRLLPRPPDTGKSREYWIQRSISLTEEYCENLKYVNVNEIGNDVNDVSSSRVKKEGEEEEEEVEKKKEELQPTRQSAETNKASTTESSVGSGASKARRLPNIDAVKQDKESGTANDDDDKQPGTAKDDDKRRETRDGEPGLKPARRLPDASLARSSGGATQHQVAEKSDASFSEPNTQNTGSSKSPSRTNPLSGQPQNTGSSNFSSQDNPLSVQQEESLHEQSAVLAHLRVPGRQIPAEFKSALCRHSSNASDTLSAITEMSESFGEADLMGNGNSSDDTLHQAAFDESFSDDDVASSQSVQTVEGHDVPASTVRKTDRMPPASAGHDAHGVADDSLSLASSHNISDLEWDKKSEEEDDRHKTLAAAATLGSTHKTRDIQTWHVQRLPPEYPEDITVVSTSDDSGFIDHNAAKVGKKATASVCKSKVSHISNNRSSCRDGGGDDNSGVVGGDNDDESGDDFKKSKHDTESESCSSYCVDPGSGKATLLSMALEQQKQTLVQHPPLRQLKLFRMLSESMSDSSLDVEDWDGQPPVRGGAAGNAERRKRRRVQSNDRSRRRTSDGYGEEEEEEKTSRSSASTYSSSRLDSYDAESLRDSDSGVTSSSHQSQVTTPEQRSLNNEKGVVTQPSYASTDKSSVPTIAVTEEAKEEDDDLDELFSKHRNDSSLLGSRSSLRDSRESLYSVYSNAEENYGNVPVSGEILFHLTYDYKHSILTIHVKQCKDVAPVDTKHNRSDPYVKTYLLPDKTRASKRKTKIKRHTLNPVFDEVLKYTVSKAELDSRTLWISVWNNDRFGRNDFLGEVTVPLAYYKFDNSTPTWYLLQERAAPEDTSLMTYKGDLHVSIKYVPASMVDSKKKPGSKKSKSKGKADVAGLGEVHVLVKAAKNITAMRGAAGSNAFCKGYLLPDKTHHSKQKTPVVKKSTSPEWQHILVFEGVDENQLEHHGVELTVWDYEKLASNDFLGGVRLNLGIGTSKGKPAEWMDAKGEEIEVWQAMMEAPNEWMDSQLPLRSSMGSQAADNKR